ncbi:MbtH family NRPS accessory protein [Streptosporangium sp. NPDC001681]|uniref:MbtH family protein n=1 Tax=Streptosporangium sp. NPDC001681 TaxID=3154395 RepID=UPI003323293C
MNETVERWEVVVNDEEQYSVWPCRRPRPEGWHPAGFSGSKSECLDHVERAWTDMRPRSLRIHMESAEI